MNIGYDDDVTVSDLVDMSCRVSGKQPAIVFDKSKPEGRFRKCADARRLREATDDYQPEITLEQGIAEMVDWYHRSFTNQPSNSNPR